MKRALIVITLLVALGAAAAYFFLVPKHHLPDDLLAAVPADAYGVLRVDVPSVLGSDAYKRLVVERGGAEGVARVTKTCGFNPLEKLTELVVFARPSPEGKLPRFAFVARGDLPHEKLIECVKKFGSGDGESKLKREDIEGVPTVASTGGSSRAGFVGRDGVVGGDAESVRAVINVVVGKAQGVSTDPVMRELYTEAKAGTDIALVGRIPDELRTLMLLLTARAAGGALMPLSDVKALSANASLAQGKVAGGAVLITGDAAKATALVDLAKGQIDRLLAIPGVGLTPAGSVLRGIQMEARAERATFTGSIKVATIEALLELLPALGQLEGVLKNGAEPAKEPAAATADAGTLPAPPEPPAAPEEPAKPAKKPRPEAPKTP